MTESQRTGGGPARDGVQEPLQQARLGGDAGSEGTADEHGGTELEPLAWSSSRIVLGGLALWAVALVVTLVVPSLHTGDRDWWPWCCVAGLALGSLGYAYMRRGRGNAAGAL
ncbi:hypothetical protein GCM10027517_20450 [Phycicoccus ginsengisoli]